MESSRIALPIGSTLNRFIKSKQKQFPFATGELSQLLQDIALAGKVVDRKINKAGLVDIIEQAGGLAIDGKNAILEIKPKNIHQRVPLFLGSKVMVKEVMKILKENG